MNAGTAMLLARDEILRIRNSQLEWDTGIIRFYLQKDDYEELISDLNQMPGVKIHDDTLPKRVAIIYGCYFIPDRNS